jgi:hypothetical protein
MNENEVQPDAGNQEAVENPVVDKLGLLDERDLSALLKSNFLDEQGDAPATQEQVADADLSETDEGSVDEPESHDGDEGNLSRGVQKRINKLVAAKKAAQAELEAQRQRLAEMERELASAKQAAPQSEQEVSGDVEALNTFDEVNNEYNRAVNAILWCEQNRNGATLNGVDLSDEDILDIKMKAIRIKEIELPARFNYLQKQASLEQGIVQDFPWWGKPETEEYQAAQQILREFPELKKRRADFKHVAGIVVLGLKAYTDLKSKKTTQAPIKKAPPQPGVRQAPPASSHQQSTQKAKQQFARSGGDRDGLSDLVKNMGFV